MTRRVSTSSHNESEPILATPIKTAVRNHLGWQLRNYYGPVVDEPLPDNLRELLDRLAEADEQGRG
jgi:hypothetical protein